MPPVIIKIKMNQVGGTGTRKLQFHEDSAGARNVVDSDHIHKSNYSNHPKLKTFDIPKHLQSFTREEDIPHNHPQDLSHRYSGEVVHPACLTPVYQYPHHPPPLAIKSERSGTPLYDHQDIPAQIAVKTEPEDPGYRLEDPPQHLALLYQREGVPGGEGWGVVGKGEPCTPPHHMERELPRSYSLPARGERDGSVPLTMERQLSLDRNHEHGHGHHELPQLSPDTKQESSRTLIGNSLPATNQGQISLTLFHLGDKNTCVQL